MIFPETKFLEMFMTAIFMFCSRKRKWFRCNVAEIAGTMLEIVRYFTHHKTTIISRFLFWKMPQEESLRKSLLWRQMTGKFRKVASHYAPEPAFGLFLNLPWGVCPLEPRHVNGVSNPAKCPPDIPSEDLLID